MKLKNNAFSHEEGINSVLIHITIIAITVCAVVIGCRFDPIHFQSVDVNKVTSLLAYLFTVALFIERFIEVIVAILRNQGAAEFEYTLENTKKNKGDEAKAESDLIKYRMDTQKLSLRISFTIGIVVSAIGIRALSGLGVDIPNLPLDQKNYFNIVDIFITAGLLAGGSEGIHQLTTVYDNYMKLFAQTATDKAKTKISEEKSKVTEPKAK